MPPCPFCNASTPADAAYCPKCGAALGREGTAIPPRSIPAAAAPPPEESPFETQILELLKRNELIPAIKLYREQTGRGLKESKDAVESLAARHGIAPPPRAGCAGMLVLMCLLTMIVATTWRHL